ncbi:recombinase family protein [Nocardia sp. CDC160]|uniref:recombinase family protein n=1 Tax=Nocardia sp. CDC160 TaxID=3112166 RepID=UPI002DC02A0D|nr:recombinase family protein [Nocardia sp. CDC160]MEC3920229.1 recombinase family protein [Nocardia sp. CDC160]
MVTAAAATTESRQTVLTTTKFDRFTRNLAEAGKCRPTCATRVLLFGLGSQTFGRDDLFGKLFLQTLGIVAKFEANLNHMCTRKGMAKTRATARRRGKEIRKCPSRHARRSTASPPVPHRGTNPHLRLVT